jgi:hypothetical protein
MIAEAPYPHRPSPMLPTEDLLACGCVLIHDPMPGRSRAEPAPGPAPARTDHGLPAITVARHLLGRRSEAGFLTRGSPRLRAACSPCRRTRARPATPAAGPGTRSGSSGTRPRPGSPQDDCQQADTSALPARHPSPVPGPGQRSCPRSDPAAPPGRDPAHAQWSCAFRPAARTDPGSPIVRARPIVPSGGQRARGRPGTSPRAPRPRVTCPPASASTAGHLPTCSQPLATSPAPQRPSPHTPRCSPASPQHKQPT